MAVKIGEAFVDITARMDKYDKGLAQSQSRLKTFGSNTSKATSKISSAFSTLGKVIPLFGFAALAVSMGKVIKKASDFEEATQKFNVIFRDVGDEANKMAASISESYGLAKSETITLLGNTGDLLTGFGATGAEALSLSARVQELAADTASFSNIAGGTAQASKALTAALLGEREQAKLLGVVITEQMVNDKLAAEGKDNLTGKAKLLARAEATLTIATEQSKNAIGDFARSSGSSANVFRRLAARMEDMGVELGQQLLPGLTSLGRTMLIVSKDGSPLFDLLKQLASGFGGLVKGISNVANGLNILLGNMNKLGIDQAKKFNAKDIQDWEAKSIKAFGGFSQEGENVVQTMLRIQQTVQQGGLLPEGLDINEVDRLNQALDERNGILQRDIDLEKKIATINASSDASRAEVFNEESDNIAKNADARLKAREAELKGVTKTSDAWRKAKEDASGFIKDIMQAIESPEQRILRTQEEQISQIEKYKNKALITEQEYADGVVAINMEAERQLAELRKQRHDEQMANLDTALSKSTEFIGLLSEAFAVDDSNRLASIENKKQKKIEQLNSEFEKEKQIVKDTIKNTKKADKAIAELEDKRAAKETEINKKADKEKGEIQRKAFERDKAFRIIQTVIATSAAIINALTTTPFPAGIAFAALAGVMGAIQIGIIAAAKPPALAKGGIVTEETIATIGEAGTEAVLPLTGPEGAKTRQLFVDDIISSIAQRSTVTPEAEIVQEKEMTFNVQVNVGTDSFFGTITQGIENREILIDERSLVKR